MVKFYVNPVPKLGIAMRRIANALRETAPPWARVVRNVAEADVQLLHPVALDVRKHLLAPRCAVMMHCLNNEQGPKGGNVPIVVPPNMEPWDAVWRPALVPYRLRAGYLRGPEPGPVHPER